MADDAVMVWNPSMPLSSAEVRSNILERCSENFTDIDELLISSNPVTMQWADTFGFDDQHGSIMFTTNRLQLFLNNLMDFTGASGSNFRIFNVSIQSTSYLTGNPVPKSLPCETQTTTQFDIELNP
jgi:hypothetical protein